MKILAHDDPNTELFAVQKFKSKELSMSTIALAVPAKNLKGDEIALEDRFISSKEVCDLLGIGRATLYRAMERCEFPPNYQITKGRIGWLQSDISEYKELGFLNFCKVYGEKIKELREQVKAA